MKKYFFLFLLAILLVGCAPNRAMNYFEKEEMYAKSLQYTNKCDIVYDNQVKVMFTALYLNSVDPKYNDDYENFIISAYVVESNEYNESFYENELFQVLLNDTNFIAIEPLSPEHEMFGNIPLHNIWTSYYLVRFNSVKIPLSPIKVGFLTAASNRAKEKKDTPIPYDLKLKLNHTTLGSCVVNFREE